MKQAQIRVGVMIPSTGALRWHRFLLDSLGEAGVAVRLEHPGATNPADATRDAGHLHPVALPWRALLPLERLLARPRPDLLASADIPAVSLAQARPDILVLTPGALARPDLAQDLLERLPWGVLEIEPVHPAAFGPGVLTGRMLWRRSAMSARLASETVTCRPGPLPLDWAKAHFAKTALMPARLIARLELEGEDCWRACPEASPLPPYTPGPGDWLRFLGELAAYGLTRAWQDIFHRRQWFLAVRPGNGDPTRPGFSQEPFVPLLPPGKTGWADPFLFTRDGRTWLFIEEIPFGKKGVLSVLELLPDGGWSDPRRVLEEPFHLSYPNVFEHDGQMYMVPETAEAGQVRLYRATDFPGGWVLDRILLNDAPGTDATFVEHGGVWWMFVNLRAPGGSSWDELHLYRGESRLGPFRPHPLNPVVSDVCQARPAGRIIRRGGKLYRPAQDCSGWYGRALAVMEITRLDEAGYEERPASRLEPELIAGSFCLHTFEAEGALEVVDGQRRVPLWR
ncbi:glucosamine inositolphosphorylceramide transferase family protein [Fundidesulfovibrio putealis]|uniref:glucosamine inositolphosphorylceramide transferase family protein n=1 Tax=Fundidesulfovibrio putealis TaxID=270496 RepID=UPI0003F66B0D|nr:hypothetical protein [Fundidesulfovibrio putealis]